MGSVTCLKRSHQLGLGNRRVDPQKDLLHKDTQWENPKRREALPAAHLKNLGEAAGRPAGRKALGHPEGRAEGFNHLGDNREPPKNL